jgi:hypothetical protein
VPIIINLRGETTTGGNVFVNYYNDKGEQYESDVGGTVVTVEDTKISITPPAGMDPQYKKAFITYITT